MKTTKMSAILVLRSELLRRVALVLALGLMLWPARVSKAAPMGTAFTYQGRLIDANSAADGEYDFEFKLFDDANTVIGNQLGSTIDINDLDVIDGYFTVELDFGSDVFDGDARWLETGVRPGDSSDVYTTLSPRQEITAVPYALQTRGMFVDNAGNVGIGTTSLGAKFQVAGDVLIGDYVLTDEFDYWEDQSSHSYVSSGQCYQGVYSCSGDLSLRIGFCDYGPGSAQITVSVTTGTDALKLRYRVPWSGGPGGTLYIDGVQKGSIVENGCNWQQKIITGISMYTGDGQVDIKIADEHSGCDGDVQITYLEVYSANKVALFADSDSARVGIGTTSPTEKLEVDGIVKAKGFEGSSLITSIKVPADLEITMEPVDNPSVYSSLDVFKTGGAPIFSLSETGNITVGGDAFVKGKVGIGAVAGPYKLDVSGDIHATGTIYGTVSGTVDNADKVDGYHYSSSWPTTLANIQGACSNNFHNIGGIDDDVPDSDVEVPDYISINNGRLYAPAGAASVGIGTTSPAQKLDVAGNVTASRYYDRNNPAYYVDPAGTSYCNDMRANIFYDRGNTGYYLDPAGTSICNTMRSSIFYDRDNTGYYVNPASTSSLYNVRAWDGSATINYATGSGELYVERDLEVDGPVYMVYVYGNSMTGRDVMVNSSGRLGTLFSSKRFKDNIVPLEDDFTKILGARTVTFTWKESKEPDIGLIAEDMDELDLQNLVIYDAEGRPESVRYKFVSLYLLEVLKDQASSIKELKAENESLKKQLRAENQSVKQRLDALEGTIQQLAKAKEVQL